MKNSAKKQSSKTSCCEPIAIIGMSCLFPQADHLSAYWANIKNGVDTLTDVPASYWEVEDFFDPDPKTPDHTYVKKGGFINSIDFDPLEFGIAPNAIETTDTSQLLGMYVAKRALLDSGYGKTKEFDKDRVGVILGVTGALELATTLGQRLGHPKWKKAMKDAGIDDEQAADAIQRISDSYAPWKETSFPGLLGNVVAGRVSNYMDLGGTNCVVDAACASSHSAMHLAIMELQSNKTDMVITGGIDTFNDIFMYMCFSKTFALSKEGTAKPFDSSADGTILGEGLGLFVLKRLEDAERDNDQIYSVIRSIGTSSDGKGQAIYAPSATGQMKALKEAYSLAGIDPTSIEMIEAHGTGTKVGDTIEITSLSNIFGKTKEKPWCAIGSVKSQIGHTKAAAGAAGIMKASMALYNKILPPTIKVNDPLEILKEEGSPFYLNSHPKPWLAKTAHPRRAGVSAFGFGGSNYHCVLEEYTPKKELPDYDGNIEILTFSAAKLPGLAEQLDQFKLDVAWDVLVAQARKTRQDYRPEHNYRLLMVVDRSTDLEKLFKVTKQNLHTQQDKKSWSVPQNVFYSSGQKPGKLAFLFPGQGSQYVGMMRALSCQFPQLLDSLTMMDQTLRDDGEEKISDFIYPPAAFTDEAATEQKVKLTNTKVAQPAIGSVSAGALKILAGFNIHPDATAGHSFGELVALHAAGAYDESSLFQLSKLRGNLMAAIKGESGGMLVVFSSTQEIQKVLTETGIKLTLANQNSPTQTVLSGSGDLIARAAKEFELRNIKSTVLPVSAAFHSDAVSEVCKPLLKGLENIHFNKVKIDVYSTATGQKYPGSANKARELLTDQVVKPVLFTTLINNMYDDGIRTFVEVGPNNVLQGLTNEILGSQNVHCLSIDASRGKSYGVKDLACNLALLSSLGYNVDLSSWNQNIYQAMDRTDTGKNRMAIPISGINHVSTKIERPPTPAKPAATSPAAPLAEQTAPPASSPAKAKEGRDMELTTEPPVLGRAAAKVSATANQPNDRVANQFSNAALQELQAKFEALQTLQEQTAKIHGQFLDNQKSAADSIQMLLAGQVGQMPVGNNTPVPNKGSSNIPAPTVTSEPQATKQVAAATVRSESVASQQATPTAAVAATAAAPTAAVSPDNAQTQHITQVLNETIADKTGYPIEMLEMDMTLDNDLGIDSIKRVEILSAIQESLPSAPKIESKHLGQLHTLQDIVDHLSAGDGLAATQSQNSAHAPSSVTSGSAGQTDTAQIHQVLLDTIAEKTGYPKEMLDLGMTLDDDLGIDSIKRVEILSSIQEQLPNAPKIESKHLGQLHTLQHIIDHLAQGGMSANAVQAEKPAPVASPPVASHATQTTSAPSSAGHGEVQQVLMETIAEKTGYPVEMLDLGMTLDNDLGIDSIKRVEILSAIQEQLPQAPKIESQHLGQLQTLQHIIDHLSPHSGGSEAPAAPTPAAGEAAQTVNANGAEIRGVLLATIAEKTGYPQEMLEMSMTLDNDLGIDSIKRVEILSSIQEQLPSAPKIESQHLGQLQTLQDIIDHLSQGGAAIPQSQAAPVASAAPQQTTSVNAESSDRAAIQQVLLQTLSEKTGYPEDMLEMGMTLDNDLGIDSIKRVEILSALQEQLPGAPKIESQHIGQLQTLQHIIDHLAQGGQQKSTAPAAKLAPVATLVTSNEPIQAVLLKTISEKTGYPEDMLEMSMTLDNDLGIDSIKRVEILSAIQEQLPSAPKIESQHLGQLQTLQHIVNHLSQGSRAQTRTDQAKVKPASVATLVTTGGSAAQVSETKSVLLKTISAKTGYPEDMLEMGMTLDNDLGIDSIKRVEILSAIQEELPNAPKIESQHIGQLQTLQHIVDHLTQGLAAPKQQATQAAPAAATAGLSINVIQEELLKTISEKTGYPIDMLEMGMTLDNDLGIDSIKRVEILSTLQEQLPTAPKIESQHLGQLHTLEHIVAHLAAGETTSAAAEAASNDAEVRPNTLVRASRKPIERMLVERVSIREHNAEPVSVARDLPIWITADQGGLAKGLQKQLKEKGYKVKVDSIERLLKSDDACGGLIVTADADIDHKYMFSAFSLLQHVSKELLLSTSDRRRFFFTISKIDGSFGFDPRNKGGFNPLMGGLAGLAKTASHEWPEVMCKSIDMGKFSNPEKAAAAVVFEVENAGPTEVGLAKNQRVALQLETVEMEQNSQRNDNVVNEGEVVIVTGGARGITADIALAIARSFKPTMVLFGRSPLPEQDPSWLQGVTSEAEIKRAIMQNESGKITPKKLNEIYQKIASNRQINANIDNLRALGITVQYYPVDITDQSSVSKTIKQVEKKYGVVKGLVHGAGVLADKLIQDKTIDQFTRVYNTKILGLQNILSVIDQRKLGLVVFFSSSTARFGRKGQVDYSVANEILNKTAQKMQRELPKCRVLSVNWGPWDGGMVTPGLRALFEQEGVALIDREAGAYYLIDEICNPKRDNVEIVITGGPLPNLPNYKLAGDVSTKPSSAPNKLRAVNSNESVQAVDHLEAMQTAFTIDLDIEHFHFLKSHVINGKAVVPAAIMIEWLAHGCMHANPGLNFVGLNDFKVLKGILLDPRETVSLHILTGKMVQDNNRFFSIAKICSYDANGKAILHASATIILSTQMEKGTARISTDGLIPYTDENDIYGSQLFHGKDFQLIRSVYSKSTDVMKAVLEEAPPPAQWMSKTLRNTWITSPGAIDSSFQLMILWTYWQRDVASLPTKIGEFKQFERNFPKSEMEIIVQVTSHNDHKAVANIEFIQAGTGTLVARITDYECVLDSSLNSAFKRNTITKQINFGTY